LAQLTKNYCGFFGGRINPWALLKVKGKKGANLLKKTPLSKKRRIF